MPRIHARRTTVGLLAIAATAFAAGPAAAAPPVPCTGIAYEDPKGDNGYTTPVVTASGQAVPPAVPATPANHDVVKGFFRTDDGRVTANVQLGEVNDDVAEGSDATGVWVYWEDEADVTQFVVAMNDGSGWKFSYGHLEDGFLIDGTTEGVAHAGPNGTLEIVVPDALISEGATFLAPRARSAMMTMFEGDPILNRFSDNGPNNLAGTDYKVTPCAATSAPVQPTPAPSPAPAPAPAPAPSNDNPPAPPRAADPAAAAPSLFTITPPKLSSKLKKGKTFKVSVLSSAPAKNVTVSLVSGGKVVAKGKLKALAGKKSVKLKLAKKLSKGSYQLLVKGTDATGKAVSGAVAVTVA